jgi:3-deoxy-manno-octulosonate cytidylyltransferase (CMP-KDO synthetase)
MKAIAIIPARYESIRFPGKPLAKLGAKYIIQHVYERVQSSDLFTEVVVGTDDQRIFEAVESFGGKVILTSKKHESGTDRIAEVCRKLPSCSDADVVINVQGDEPFISREPLKKLIAAFDDPLVRVASLMHRMKKNFDDPNSVKVVYDKNNYALYFSRSVIPFEQDNKLKQKSEYFRHIGIYAFRRKILFRFVEMQHGKLEQIEKLEQLRLLENGIKIKMIETDYECIGIDTPQDLEKAGKILATKT